MVKFEVKKQFPNLRLEKEQKVFLGLLLEKLRSRVWDPQSIHNTIYEISEKHKIPVKTSFKTIYQILLGQEKGPRAGYFLSNLDKDFVLGRIKEAVK